MVLSELLAIKVPNGLSAHHGCAHRAARRGSARRCQDRITGGEAALVLGLGPVGLGASPSCASAASGDRGRPTSRQASTARRAAGCRCGRRPTESTPVIEAWRQVDGVRPLRDLRGGGRAGHDRAGHADGTEGSAHRGGGRVHAGGPDPPDARHRPRAEHPVRVGVPRRSSSTTVAHDRRWQGRPVTPGSPAPSGSMACRRRSPTWATPRPTPRSWSSPGRLIERYGHGR